MIFTMKIICLFVLINTIFATSELQLDQSKQTPQNASQYQFWDIIIDSAINALTLGFAGAQRSFIRQINGNYEFNTRQVCPVGSSGSYADDWCDRLCYRYSRGSVGYCDTGYNECVCECNVDDCYDYCRLDYPYDLANVNLNSNQDFIERVNNNNTQSLRTKRLLQRIRRPFRPGNRRPGLSRNGQCSSIGCRCF